jgi:hypothetical protein
MARFSGLHRRIRQLYAADIIGEGRARMVHPAHPPQSPHRTDMQIASAESADAAEPWLAAVSFR